MPASCSCGQNCQSLCFGSAPCHHTARGLLDFCRSVASRSLPWAWLTADGIEQLGTGTYESPDPVPPACVPVDPEQQVSRSSGDLGLSLLSLNVQTLQEKRSIILQQLQAKRTLLCGLQETRGRSDVQGSSGGFLEFASAAQAGEGGCALFISTTVPYVKIGDRPLCLTQQHCRCVHAAPSFWQLKFVLPFSIVSAW